jgi:sulfur carrier protein ThiS
MRILFVNNLGGGFADYVDVTDGTTVEQFFKDKMPNCNSADYLIRVNRQSVPKNHFIQEGDRITITPVKIDGAMA